MRPSFLLLRMLARTGRRLAPWLLLLATASVAEAAPRAARHHPPAARSQKLEACNPRTASLRRTLRRPALGPVKPKIARSQVLLADTTAQLRRAARAKLDDGDDAIQNDGAAARIDQNDDAMPGFRSLGVLSSSYDPLPLSNHFLPRSPRGPPVAQS